MSYVSSESHLGQKPKLRRTSNLAPSRLDYKVAISIRSFGSGDPISVSSASVEADSWERLSTDDNMAHRLTVADVPNGDELAELRDIVQGGRSIRAERRR